MTSQEVSSTTTTTTSQVPGMDFWKDNKIILKKKNTIPIKMLTPILDEEEEEEDEDVEEEEHLNSDDIAAQAGVWDGANTLADYSDVEEGEVVEPRRVVNRRRRRIRNRKPAMLKMSEGSYQSDAIDRRLNVVSRDPAREREAYSNLVQARDVASIASIPYYIMSRDEKNLALERVHAHWNKENKRRRLRHIKYSLKSYFLFFLFSYLLFAEYGLNATSGINRHGGRTRTRCATGPAFKRR
jgi:hypothetical protein